MPKCPGCADVDKLAQVPDYFYYPCERGALGTSARRLILQNDKVARGAVSWTTRSFLCESAYMPLSHADGIISKGRCLPKVREYGDIRARVWFQSKRDVERM